MAERQPPLYMDVSNAYSGDELGIPWRDVITEGVVVDVTGTALAVSAGTGNTVDVAAGAGWIAGDTNPDLQPLYRVFNDAIVNLGITPDPAQPRQVRIVAQIVDQAFAGVGRAWSLQAIHGAAAASPATPAIPASAISLAVIAVPAAAASSAAYTITNTRPAAAIGGRIGGSGSGGSNVIDLRNPGANGNASPTVWPGTILDLWVWQFSGTDVDGWVDGIGRATASVSSVVLDIACEVATGGVARFAVLVKGIADTESLNPAAWDAIPAVDVTVPGTAKTRKRVAFNIAAAGIQAGDLVAVRVVRQGAHANDTLGAATVAVVEARFE